MASIFGIDEGLVPRHRVGDAVDVVPPSGVEADEVAAERGADFHQLEAGLDLLDEHVDLDGAGGKAQMRLERGHHVIPERGLLGGLNLRQIEHDRRPGAAELPMVVHDVQRHVHDGRREVRRHRRDARAGRRGAVRGL